MTPNFGRDIAAGEGPAAEPVALHPPTRADVDTSCDALCIFLQGGLAAAQETIEHALLLQQEMMDVVSRHAFGADGSGQSGGSADDMQALVSALQSDDLIRQIYKNLSTALSVMSEAAAEVHGLADNIVPDDGKPMPALHSRWTADLLNSLLLDEMRQRFSRKLDTSNGD